MIVRVTRSLATFLAGVILGAAVASALMLAAILR